MLKVDIKRVFIKYEFCLAFALLLSVFFFYFKVIKPYYTKYHYYKIQFYRIKIETVVVFCFQRKQEVLRYIYILIQRMLDLRKNEYRYSLTCRTHRCIKIERCILDCLKMYICYNILPHYMFKIFCNKSYS